MIHFVLGFRTDLMGFRPGMAGDSPCMGFRTDLMRFYPSMAGDSLCMGFRTDLMGFRPGAGDPLPQRWLEGFRLLRRPLMTRKK